MDAADDAIKVLMHESDQLHQNIQRSMSEMFQIMSFGFPILGAAFTFAVKEELVNNDKMGIVYALFAILGNLLVVSFNNVWLQLNSFTRYKYVEVLPRLYHLTGRQGDNYGQDAVRRGLMRAMIGAAIVQMVLLPLGAGATYEAYCKHAPGGFLVAAFFSLGCALITIVLGWRSASEGVKAVQESSR